MPMNMLVQGAACPGHRLESLCYPRAWAGGPPYEKISTGETPGPPNRATQRVAPTGCHISFAFRPGLQLFEGTASWAPTLRQRRRAGRPPHHSIPGPAKFYSRGGKAISRAWSRRSTGWKVSSSRTEGGISSRSTWFWSGRMISLMPARCAARTLFLMPPTGRTWPRRVISPVMARPFLMGRFDSSDTRAQSRATPAEGPSLGMEPAGTWMWRSALSKKSSSMPRNGARARI